MCLEGDEREKIGNVLHNIFNVHCKWTFIFFGDLYSPTYIIFTGFLSGNVATMLETPNLKI